jgi:hypothetical protein
VNDLEMMETNEADRALDMTPQEMAGLEEKLVHYASAFAELHNLMEQDH